MRKKGKQTRHTIAAPMLYMPKCMGINENVFLHTEKESHLYYTMQQGP